MKLLRAFFSSWTWRMAWRDSRASRWKLLLFSSSIIIGIAALVAISGLAENLRRGIDRQAKSLLGADLVLASRDPFTPEMEELFRQIGGEQSREVIFSSMVTFKEGRTRLVQVRALGRGFPFYGDFEAEPASAADNFHDGGALVEESLLLQFDLRPGDTVKIGQLSLPVRGALRKVPGENAMFSTIAPRIYIPLAMLDATQLLSNDSFARFKVFFKFRPGVEAERVLRKYRKQVEALNLGADTVEERKASLGTMLENLNRFLALGGFIALLLGGIGIASAIHVHVKQKTASVAVLRCVGCSVSQTFAIYLAQALVLGLAGAIAGSLAGLGIQNLLPRILADFLPFKVEVELIWEPVFRALVAGLGVALIFALFPLLAVRRISPLGVLRASYEPSSGWRDPVYLLTLIFSALAIVALAWTQVGRWSYAIAFASGLAVAFLLLAAVAQLLRSLLRRLISPGWPFAWRQGMANLYRPHNRTLLLLLSIGLGVLLVLTIYRVNQVLAKGLFPADEGNQPNAALFDIQADHVETVKEILRERNLPVLSDVPLVTMRLASVKGKPVQKLARDPRLQMPKWILRREYRSTYRDTVDSTEQLVKGTWPVPATNKAEIPVSIEQGIARDLRVDVGDQLVFDVQGVLMTNRIASIRKVDWKRIQPNFFMVFPSGVLEEAPGFHIITTRASREASAAMQKAVVAALPNVSIIDLALVLDTVDAVVRKVSFVIRFMALFTVATGIIVLAASILTGRYQRVRETILLRTLGASRHQVHRILMAEYLLTGVLSALTGVLLAEAAAWALCRFVFSVHFEPAVLPALTCIAIVSVVTVVIGLISNRGVLDRPPLEVLSGT